MKLRIYLITVIALMCSCATKIKNFEQYQKAPLLQLEQMPTKEQLAIVMPRVMVVAEESGSELAQKSNADDLVRSSLILTLQNDKFADIVDRNHSKDILKEITIAELEGKAMNIESVDYIIKVVIDDITFSSSTFYIPPSKNSLPQSGYRYIARVDGLLSIYEIPTMKLLKTIPLRGSAAVTEESSSPIGLLKIGNLQIGSEAKTYDFQLINNAVQRAIHLSMPAIKRFLKKKAYILEKRTLKDKEIYAINRGSEHGVKSQDKLLVARNTTEINPLTDEEETFAQNICTGVVAKNTLSETRAWVVFKKECGGKLRLGDEAVVQY